MSYFEGEDGVMRRELRLRTRIGEVSVWKRMSLGGGLGNDGQKHV